MILVNLMRHDVRIETDTDTFTIPASGRVATVFDMPLPEKKLDVEGVGAVPVSTVETTVVGMPNKQDEVGFLVTYKTLNTLHGLGYDTSDLYAPDLLVKDSNGKVIGCRRLMQLKAGAVR